MIQTSYHHMFDKNTYSTGRSSILSIVIRRSIRRWKGATHDLAIRVLFAPAIEVAPPCGTWTALVVFPSVELHAAIGFLQRSTRSSSPLTSSTLSRVALPALTHARPAAPCTATSGMTGRSPSTIRCATAWLIRGRGGVVGRRRRCMERCRCGHWVRVSGRGWGRVGIVD